MSAAGEALARLPPSVPRFRICGPPTTAHAAGRAGANRATAADAIISVWVVAAPIQRSSPRSSIPCSSSTPVTSNSTSRPTFPSLASIRTSVPPASGRISSGRWARISIASSSVRGRSERGADPLGGRDGIASLPRRGRGLDHRREDLRVPGAPAEVAGQPVPDRVDIGRRLAVEQRLGREHHPRNADPALHPALVDERVLQRVHPAFVEQAFDGLDGRAVGLVGHHQAGVDGLPVDDHRAGAALALAAPFLRAGEPKVLAQHVEEALVGPRAQPHRAPVQGERDVDHLSQRLRPAAARPRRVPVWRGSRAAGRPSRDGWRRSPRAPPR